MKRTAESPFNRRLHHEVLFEESLDLHSEDDLIVAEAFLRRRLNVRVSRRERRESADQGDFLSDYPGFAHDCIRDANRGTQPMTGEVLVTGSAGLIGSESVSFFSKMGFKVHGIDNDMRKYFFGEEASTAWNRQFLEKSYSDYRHHATDIRDQDEIERY